MGRTLINIIASLLYSLGTGSVMTSVAIIVVLLLLVFYFVSQIVKNLLVIF